MTEPPDFDQIGFAMMGVIAKNALKHPSAVAHEQSARLIAAELRRTWNARGAADISTIEEALAQKPPDVFAQLRALDR
jgi:hypothetical protein